MSFFDLERGLSSDPPPRPSSSAASTLSPSHSEDAAHDSLFKSLSAKIFTITNNVASLQRMVDLLGTPRDSPRTRDQLNELTERTRELVKETTTELKSLGSLRSGSGEEGEGEGNRSGGGSMPRSLSRQRKLEQQKLTKDFQLVLARFQQTQRASAERGRAYVEAARHNMRNDTLEGEDEDDEEQGRPLITEDTRQVQLQMVEQDAEYNAALIAEREEEVRNIERGVAEVSEIFRDLGTIVTEQGSMLDNIESNITSTATHTRKAADEVGIASRYQRKARKRMCYILLILAILLAFIVLLVAVV